MWGPVDGLRRTAGPWKKGTGTERPWFRAQLGPISARSQPPFSTTAYSLSYLLCGLMKNTYSLVSRPLY